MQYKLNVPNAITIFRILLVPVFLALMVAGEYGWALAAFAVAGVSDAVDGAVARMTGDITEFGAALDPIADKTLALAAFVSLTALGAVPPWFTAIVVLRDAVIVAGNFAIHFKGIAFRIRPFTTGKAATFMQFTLIVSALHGLYCGPGGEGAACWRGVELTGLLIWPTLALIVVSGVQYVLLGVSVAKGDKHDR
ncbi:MAG: CDP-alcohol phosphatidyltransferase family protein [Nitrospirae bacterium]|nr:CDP-alcohol phosphatidyltransferase family protein [Nitrospirota bacterium]MBI5694120.1 CDP-alcohol phosphatidyltransferase family protein [Nitrospirota bacterium]